MFFCFGGPLQRINHWRPLKNSVVLDEDLACAFFQALGFSVEGLVFRIVVEVEAHVRRSKFVGWHLKLAET